VVDLSVVVPAHDARAHLGATLASLRRNGSSQIEFVVVDDASTDGTAEAVEAAVDHVPGLRLVRSPVNVGLASARNLGLDHARGRYVAFLDADDWLAPGYLPALLDVARRHDVDLLRTDHVQVRGLRRVVHRAPVARRDVVLRPREHILPANATTMVDYPFAWAGLFDRQRVADSLLRFDDGLRTAEDRPWVWRLHRHCTSFLVPALTGHFYRRDVASSLTVVVDERQLDFTRAFDIVLDELRADGEPEAFVEKAARTACAVVAHHLGRSASMTPRVRALLRERSRDLLGRVPAPVLGRVVDALNEPRRALVLGVVEGRRVRRPLRVRPLVRPASPASPSSPASPASQRRPAGAAH
jgi:glycosyltransferase involved in cell wall biosynthesis